MDFTKYWIIPNRSADHRYRLTYRRHYIISLLARIFNRVIRVLRRYGIHLFILVGMITCAVVSWVYTIPRNTTSGLNILIPQSCSQDIDQQLNDTPEVSKVASSAASTIMTLLPALLTFAPFPTASISALLAVSTGAALLTSGMGLGLPVTSIYTLSKDKIISVKELCTEDIIRRYG